MPSKRKQANQKKTAAPSSPLVRLETGKWESVKEIERLATEAVGTDCESAERSAALLELFTHIIPHDTSGWSMFARNAVIKADSELLDEAGDIIVAKRQRERKGGRK